VSSFIGLAQDFPKGISKPASCRRVNIDSMNAESIFLCSLFPDCPVESVTATLNDNDMETAVSILLRYDQDCDDEDLIKLKSLFPDVDENRLLDTLTVSENIEEAANKLLRNAEPEIEIVEIILPKTSDSAPHYFTGTRSKHQSKDVESLQAMFPQFNESSLLAALNKCKGELNAAAVTLSAMLPETDSRAEFETNLNNLMELFPAELKPAMIARLQRLKNVEVCQHLTAVGNRRTSRGSGC
jgi:hypothetical protein